MINLETKPESDVRALKAIIDGLVDGIRMEPPDDAEMREKHGTKYLYYLAGRIRGAEERLRALMELRHIAAVEHRLPPLENRKHRKKGKVK